MTYVGCLGAPVKTTSSSATTNAYLERASPMQSKRRFHRSVGIVLPHIDHLFLEKIMSLDVTFPGYRKIQYMKYEESHLSPELEWDTQPLTAVIHE